MANPTWYDILGITPEATPEQIKAAWRDATDKFEPGTGASQFRLFNEAADVLLNPAKRAEYDAELGLAPGTESEPDPEPETEPESQTEFEGEPEAEFEGEPETMYEVEPEVEPELWHETGAGIPVGVRVVAVLSVLALAALVVATIFGVRLQHDVNTRKGDASAGAEASAVAGRALTAVLSYDYRHMDADRDRSAQFLTAKYRTKFLKTYSLLTVGPNGGPGPVEKTKAVVTATVLSTAVQDAEPDEVRVLVFVNQTAVKNGGSPSIFQNRVVATMVKRGDKWLIDEVKSY